MQTDEVPREEWTAFFDDFSKAHRGWIVSLDVLAPGLGAPEEVLELPLLGVTADVNKRKNRVRVLVGGGPDVQVTRIVESPKRVWHKRSDRRGHEAIDVESDDGTVTLLRFCHVDQTDRLLPEVESETDREYGATAS